MMCEPSCPCGWQPVKVAHVCKYAVYLQTQAGLDATRMKKAFDVGQAYTSHAETLGFGAQNYLGIASVVIHHLLDRPICVAV